MKINYTRFIANLIWLVFSISLIVLVPMIIIDGLRWYGWVHASGDLYERVIILSILGSCLAAPIPIVTLCHLFNPEWDFWYSMAEKFPVKEPKELSNEVPTRGNWKGADEESSTQHSTPMVFQEKVNRGSGTRRYAKIVADTGEVGWVDY